MPAPPGSKSKAWIPFCKHIEEFIIKLVPIDSPGLNVMPAEPPGIKNAEGIT